MTGPRDAAPADDCMQSAVAIFPEWDVHCKRRCAGNGRFDALVHVPGDVKGTGSIYRRIGKSYTELWMQGGILGDQISKRVTLRRRNDRHRVYNCRGTFVRA